MSQFLALLRDSFHEALDRKMLVVLLALSGLLILFCFGLSFETGTPGQVLAEQAAALDKYSKQAVSWESISARLGIVVGEAQPVDAQGGWRSSLVGGHSVDIAFADEQRLATALRNWRERGGRRKQPPPAAADEGVAFLEQRFARFGYQHVQARRIADRPPAFRVAVRTDYPHELRAASQVHVLFGLLTFPLWGTSMAETVVGLQLVLAQVCAGLFGMLVCVLVCASFVPDMLQKGSLDLVLARPIGRGRLLVYKYVGGVAFIGLLTSVLIVGCWLGISLRTGFWNPWFLASILTITGSFAVIHAVSVLFGVLTRSGTVSGLLAIAVWGLSTALVAVHHGKQFFGAVLPGWVSGTIDVLYAVLPKTLDLSSLTLLVLSRSHLSQEAYQRTFAKQIPRDIDWAYSLGTTAAFTVAVLALATWLFRRRDH